MLLLSNQNPKIGRRPENLDILSRKMDLKCVFRAFGTQQAPKIFACGAKTPLKLIILEILEIDFLRIRIVPRFVSKIF